MHTSWLSLVPPFIVIVAAFATKKLNQSLILGLVIAALIAVNGQPFEGLSLLATRLYNQISDFDNACNYVFLIMISTLIVLIGQTGGALAFAHSITKRLRSKKMVEIASLFVSSTLFIDDYLSNLTTGYSMRSLSDRYAIPRAKLAFLVHSLSSPLVVLSPVSSWIAQTTGFIESADIALVATASTKIIAEPFVALMQTVPFMFFSLFIIFSTWFIVLFGISFGPMHTHELVAEKNGNLFGGKEAPEGVIVLHEKSNASSLDMIVPILMLIGFIIVGFLYAGGYHLFGGTQSFIGALQHNTKTALVLLIAGTITLILSIIMALARATITSRALPGIAYEGFNSIYSAILMIYMATTLGVMMKEDLNVGVYLAGLVQESMPLWLLPSVLFVLATIISFMIGSTWGTIALLAPIGTQVLIALTSGTPPFPLASLPMLLPVLGGIFAGAICGNYISPISDTTIMASASVGTYPIDHIITQLPYAMPAIVSSIMAFTIAGILAPQGLLIAWGASIFVGLLSTLCMLLIANKFFKKS